jgi:hypothetical protein
MKMGQSVRTKVRENRSAASEVEVGEKEAHTDTSRNRRDIIRDSRVNHSLYRVQVQDTFMDHSV